MDVAVAQMASEVRVDLRENPESHIFAQQFFELYKPEVLEQRIQHVLENNPELTERVKEALESGDPGKIGRIRGIILMDVVINELAPFVSDVRTEVTVDAGDGRKSRIDYMATTNCDLYFGGNRDNTVYRNEGFCIEIKTGNPDYLRDQLNNKGFRQALAHDGKSVMLVSMDFKDLPIHTQDEIRNKYRESGIRLIAALPRASVMDTCMERASSARSRYFSQ